MTNFQTLSMVQSKEERMASSSNLLYEWSEKEFVTFLQRKLEKDCASETPCWTQILLGRFTLARILFFASVLRGAHTERQRQRQLWSFDAWVDAWE